MGPFLIVVLSILLGVVIFLAVRSLLLWYWRIDTIVSNQEMQIALLKELLEKYRTLKPGTEVDLKL